MEFAAIMARSLDGVIGTPDGTALPWRIPEDLKRFKRMTTNGGSGGVVIMGRRTFDTIGRALPSRENLVVSRRWGPRAGEVSAHDRVWRCASPLDAQRAANEIQANQGGPGTAWVIGGAELYAAMWSQVQRLELTVVGCRYGGGVGFSFDRRLWRQAPQPGQLSNPTGVVPGGGPGGADLRYHFETWLRVAPEPAR